jgi:8-oxo-dGTP diphosphatase
MKQPTATVIRVVSAEIVREGRYLLTQRSAHAVLPLLWEFPGGRVRPGESDADALARCLRARLGVNARVGSPTMEVHHCYDTYSVNLAVYQAELEESDNPVAVGVEDLAWVSPEELESYAFPEADQQTIELLLTHAE